MTTRTTTTADASATGEIGNASAAGEASEASAASEVSEVYDVLIVGGGPAGLGAAIALGRALRSVLVVDSGAPRNVRAEGAHNVVGNEGIAPLDLHAKGREEARGYGAVVADGTVASVAGARGAGFTAELTDGTRVRARRILLATGARDVLPAVTGLAERFGRDAFHCPYCHGWEVRGERIGVIATGPLWPHHAQLIRQWSPSVTVMLGEQPEPDEALRARLAARGVELISGAVEEVLVKEDRITGVRTASGTVPLDAVLTGTYVSVESALTRGLGVAVEDHPSGMGQQITVDMRGQTTVPGVFAAGNCADVTAQVGSSAAAGTMAGAQINMDLVEEDFDAALAGAAGPS
ncbi:NAD(P)/FAD-dependent oxidoreductase [Brevibacterium salitolerans]|uniref:NAD(P)/FAD-dependent oxidoreductase n=1 Tax=Brevibacterium salitolerans TaxID=1403566 RepID=A0ABP5I8L8_9MICO